MLPQGLTNNTIPNIIITGKEFRNKKAGIQ